MSTDDDDDDVCWRFYKYPLIVN